ncbi:hypothetical protein M9Y10_040396 [Tritrichomonas musculus]|uniref:Uncharacterized protein n=1 Tax=Tritrichomonas musculus TaxID=1915356 RepID=A0ABR2GPH3_9EUKA
MLVLLLPILILAENDNFPKISYFIVSDVFTHIDMDLFEDWIDDKENMMKMCQSRYGMNETKRCRRFVKSISSIVLSNGKDVNEDLSEVSKKTEYLIYAVHTRHTNVDFKNLKNKMSVIMLPISFTSNLLNNENKIDNIKHLIFELSKKIMKSSFITELDNNMKFSHLVSENDDKDKLIEVIIDGSIKKKVSFLTISHLKVVFYNDLNCENVFITSSMLSSLKKTTVVAKNFIVDANTYSLYKIPLTNVDQFSILDFNKNIHKIPQYRISYLEKSWGIQIGYDEKFNNDEYNWSVSYLIAKKFSLICYSNHIFIEAVSTNLDKYSDINITIIDEGLRDYAPLLPLVLSENQVIIESTGFDSISKSKWPSVVVTYDKSKFTIDTSNLELKASVQSDYSENTQKVSASIGLIVGIVAVVVIVVIIILIVVVQKKKKASMIHQIEKILLTNDQDQGFTAN